MVVICVIFCTNWYLCLLLGVKETRKEEIQDFMHTFGPDFNVNVINVKRMRRIIPLFLTETYPQEVGTSLQKGVIWIGCPFPAPIFVRVNSGIAKTDSRAPRNVATHVQWQFLCCHGWWSVRHATRNDWRQALPTILLSVCHAHQIKRTIKIQFHTFRLQLYAFIHHYNLDNSRTSCQSLAFTHNISAVSWCCVGEVHVIIRLSF